MQIETSNLNVTQVAAVLKATPQTLRRQIGPIDADVLRWRPNTNDWCVNEIIGHLIEADQRSFAGRIQAMLAYEMPELETWDAGVVASMRRDDQKDVLELLAEFEAMRHENMNFVAGLRPGQLARAGFHPDIGEVQVVDFVYEWLYHDCNHIKQILSNIQIAVWPKMGNTRHFAPPQY